MAADQPTLPSRGERLRDLAEMEALTLRDLASDLGIAQSSLSRIINGTAPLTTRLAQAAISRFDLPASFLTVVPAQQDQAALTFRKRASSSTRSDKRITRLFREASRLWRTASEDSGYPAADLATMRDHARDGRVEDAAAAVRSLSGIDPQAAIGNMIRFVEKLGIGVIMGLDPDLAQDNSTDEDETSARYKEHSGATCPSLLDDRPLIATIGPQPGAVLRMTVAHELGHLIFDPDLQVPPRSRDLPERRAFAFAGALLLPETMMRRRVTMDMTLNAYLRIKADYGVSVGAIVMRAQRLGIITPERARSLHIQISSRGWRDNEPVPVLAERPLLVRQASERVWPVNTVGAAAQAVGVKVPLVSAWLDSPAPTSRPLAGNVITLASRRASSGR